MSKMEDTNATENAFLEELAQLCWKHKKAFVRAILCDLPHETRQVVLDRDGCLNFIRGTNPPGMDPSEYWKKFEGALVVAFPETEHEKLEWAARAQEREVGVTLQAIKDADFLGVNNGGVLDDDLFEMFCEKEVGA